MTSNGNSVNIKSAERGYHHGDLRPALVAAGLKLLKSRSVEELSLREISRTVGVSATAVYRHFPDKQALLYALCAEGAEDMARLQYAALSEAGGGLGGFAAVGEAYVVFALDNPALFRLMMSTHPKEVEEMESTAVGGAMQLLKDCVAETLPANASNEERRIAALWAWGLVHGLAMLMLDGQVPVDRTIIGAIIRTNIK